MRSENDEQQNPPSQELAQFQKLMHEQVRHFSFHNDHIMRGPLCRAMGLVNLLKRENLNSEASNILDMLRHELTQMENVTLMISKMLDDHENNLEDRIDQ